MSQKEVNAEYIFDVSVFRERFHKLRKSLKLSQAEFAAFLEIPTGSVGGYESGDKTPNSATLFKIAKKCNVSTDYLLGLQKEPTLDEDIKKICDYTGLSGTAVSRIRMFHDDVKEKADYRVVLDVDGANSLIYSPDLSFDILNQLLCNPHFYSTMSAVADYKISLSKWICECSEFLHTFCESSEFEISNPSINSDNLTTVEIDIFLDTAHRLLGEKLRLIHGDLFQTTECFKDSIRSVTENDYNKSKEIKELLTLIQTILLTARRDINGEHN